MKLGLQRYKAGESQVEVLDTLGRLLDVADTGSVFSEPVKAGNSTVITAAEISVGMGFGVGSGQGPTDEGGSGGGGGGFSAGRPVAAIIAGPKGVHVEPIVDVTKLGIAFLTTVGAICGYCAIGRRMIASAPPSMTRMAMTQAKIGRLMKKCDMTITAPLSRLPAAPRPAGSGSP